MQVFIPYPQPFWVAKCLDKRRLNKQIIEGHQIIAAANGETKAWANHPVTKMYKDHLDWLKAYVYCLEFYKDGKLDVAKIFSHHADSFRPSWMTETLCDSHKRRLVAKDPELYKQFYIYGISEINYYVVDGLIWGYARGKNRFSLTLEEFNNGKM